MPVTLPDDARAQAIAALQTHFRDERDEALGVIAAGDLVDWFLKEVGPAVHNRAVRAAQERLQGQLAELDLELYEDEFPLSRRR